MDILRRVTENPKRALIIAGFALLGLLLVAFVLQILGTSFGAISQRVDSTMNGMTTAGYGYGGGGSGMIYDTKYDYAMSENAAMPQLSVRNVSGIVPPQPTYPSGDTAENYEVTQYNAQIETTDVQNTCDSILALKAREDVIFDNSNVSDHYCSFTFKVKQASTEEILAFIETFDPRDLSDNTYTIKQQIDDYTSEVDVLQKKRAAIDATLSSALSAYDDITHLATQTQNADALAKIISSRVETIQQMTQERININDQLDRLARAKADQLDRLEYTYFGVNVQENKYVDWQGLGDSWKAAIKSFVYGLNKLVQDVTINLVLLVLLIAQWVLYAVIVLVVAKYGWKLAKYIWLR